MKFYEMDKEQGFPLERQNTTDTVDTDDTSDTNNNISKSVIQTTKIADKLLWILGGWKSVCEFSILVYHNVFCLNITVPP